MSYAKSFSVFTRRAATLAIALALAATQLALLPGCNVLRRARKVQVQPPPPFQSPLAQPVGGPGMTADQLRVALGDRRTDTRAIRATMSISIGDARSSSRQQFDANVYSALPNFLRVRGSADAGTLFDFLLDKGRVEVMIVPDKKIYIGTLAQLRTNTTLMAGLQPDDLMNSFFVEQNLYRALRENPQVPLQETPDHYIATVGYAGGTIENYHLRKTDLLVDQVDRTQGAQSLGVVRYYGYQFYGGNYLLPSRFDASLPNGGQASVTVTELHPNEARTPEIAKLKIPDGFERLSL
jgi:hypothetical protein